MSRLEQGDHGAWTYASVPLAGVTAVAVAAAVLGYLRPRV